MYNMTYGPVKISITNEFEKSGCFKFTVYPKSDCGRYIYSNSVSDNITIHVDHSEANSVNALNVSSNDSIQSLSNVVSTFMINIYNSQSSLFYSASREGKNFDIFVSKLAIGIYIVEITNGLNSYRKQLVINKN
jgi:hypothetical protein